MNTPSPTRVTFDEDSFWVTLTDGRGRGIHSPSSPASSKAPPISANKSP